MFPRPRNFPRPHARAAACILLALAFVFAARHSAEAAGTFVSAPGRVDMVYDSARDTLYITSGGSVLRYQLGTDSFLTPFNLGGSLAGLDLSPDGNTLVIADSTRTASNTWVHVIDLRTGAGRKVLFPRDSLEGGTFTVAYGADNRVLITSTFEGSGWVPLRQLDTETGVWRDLKSQFSDIFGAVRQNTMLAASGDRSVVGFAESDASDGPLGRFRVSDSNIIHDTGYASGTGWYNYEMGVNRNGTQYAVPTYFGTFIYNANLAKTGTVVGQYAGPQPVGVVYHPVEDIVYFPWATTNEVRAFDTNTFAQVAAYDFEDTFTGNGNFAFRQGRMKMSRDGSLLFATVTGGVRFVRLYAPLAAADQSVSATEDSPVSFSLSASVGNGAAVSYRVETAPTHGRLGGSGGNLTYTPDPDYNGRDTFTYRAFYGTAESAPATVSIAVAPSNDPPMAESQSIILDEDTARQFVLYGWDTDADALGYSVVSGPTHGTLSGTGVNVVYTPAPDYSGPDSFSFKLNDGRADSNEAIVFITVNAVNDAPVAFDDADSTSRKSSVSVPVLFNDRDADGDALTVVAVTQPPNGSAGIAPGGKSVTYTPKPNFRGNDTFKYTVSDGRGGTASATATVTVSK